jgi:hypothetical protein
MELPEYQVIQQAQAAAVKAAVIALLDIHPQRQRLAAHLTKTTDFLMGQYLNSQDIPDGFVAEFQRQMGEFQKRCQ